MKKLFLSLSIGAMLVATPSLADPKEGKGPPASHGHDKGPGQKGNGAAKGPQFEKMNPGQARKIAQDAKPMRELKNDKPDKLNAPGRFDASARPDMKAMKDKQDDYRRDVRDWNDRDKWVRPKERDFDREPYEIVQAGRYFGFAQDDRRGLIDGCPPGLAKKNNGCMPPGLAKKERDGGYWDRLWRRDDGRYYYRDGYLMRYNDGGVLGYLPLLGGALSVGSLFPRDYRSAPVSDYYANFYGDDDDYVYRYSDGVIYALDPQSYAISEVVGLLTGDEFTIGEPMPLGYSVYNVPYGYRDRYVDGPDNMYRYSDGYIYRVDPTTQLVKAAIQLLS